MLETTLHRLACPGDERPCLGSLSVAIDAVRTPQPGRPPELDSGILRCERCGARYPIVAGIAILLADWKDYLLSRWPLVSRLPDERIPRCVIEEGNAPENVYKRYVRSQDWESDDILNAYLLNHFLCYSLEELEELKEVFTAPRIFDLVTENWAENPHFQMRRWLADAGGCGDFLELGCSVGGTATLLPGLVRGGFLGIDLSLRSVAAARTLLLDIRMAPQGLLPQGFVADAEMWIDPDTTAKLAGIDIDFVVGSAWSPPVRRAVWDFVSAVNMVDFSPDPVAFARMEQAVLAPAGRCFVASPLSPFSPVASILATHAGKPEATPTDALVEVYRQAGLSLLRRRDDLPWVMPRGPRYVEYFSVDALFFRADAGEQAKGQP